MTTMTMRGVVLSAVAVLAPMLVAAQETHRVSGADVSVYNLAGKVEVVRGSGQDVVVKITRGGADAARLEVLTGEIDGRSTLRVVYPDDQVSYPAMGGGSNTSLRAVSYTHL